MPLEIENIYGHTYGYELRDILFPKTGLSQSRYEVDQVQGHSMSLELGKFHRTYGYELRGILLP